MAKRTAGSTARWRLQSPAHRETHRSFSKTLEAGRQYVRYTLEIPGRRLAEETIDLAAQTATWLVEAPGLRRPYAITIERVS